MTTKFSNQLTDAEAERLAILLEELGEAQQAIGKILRHGYESVNPTAPLSSPTNREALVRELGDIRCIVAMMEDAGDFRFVSPGIDWWAAKKAEKIVPYLHHQEVPNDHL